MRVINRRYARENQVVASSGATHVIKIGFNAGAANEVKPGKLNGFLIYHDRLGNDNKLMIDYEAMERLGHRRDAIQKALAGGFKADDGLLPQALQFVLMCDAKPLGDGHFDYPGIIAESYECYTKAGLFCFGTGATALRKMENGTKQEIVCNPVGKRGVEAQDFCPYSVNKSCKSHYRLLVVLYYVDAMAKAVPVSPSLGAQARFRLDSSSEYASSDILDQLDAAARRVRGRLNGITGTLMFQKKARRTGLDGPAAKSIVGHVMFRLNEESIRTREEQISREDEQRWSRQIEAGKLQLQIEPPAPGPAQAVDIQLDTVAEPVRVRAAPAPAPVVSAPPVSISPREARMPASEAGGPKTTEDFVLEDAPGGENQFVPVKVADATDEELIDALGWCADQTAKKNSSHFTAELALLTTCQLEGKDVSLSRLDYFTEGKGENDAKRRALLRSICVGLEEKQVEFFAPLRRADFVEREGMHE